MLNAVSLLLVVAARNFVTEACNGPVQTAAEIRCEKIILFDLSKKCCYLNSTTKINEIHTTLADLESFEVDAILFDNNKKIEFLPVKIYKKFPNLESYLARNTSVKEISALTFEKLSSLKLLDLRENEIESIPNLCFDDLIKLNLLRLGTIISNIRKIFVKPVFLQVTTKSHV